MNRLIVLVALLGLTACSHSSQKSAGGDRAVTTPATADTSAQGIVRSVGADPFAQIVLQPRPGMGSGQVRVVGDLLSEISQLQGAEVLVRGVVHDNRPPNPRRAIDVADYEIISVGGERPQYVGTLTDADGTLMLSHFIVVGAPQDLANAVGGKVWISGSVSGDSLRVSLYGVIVRP
ncbi:MAG: hypothetical protein O7D29_01060 [Gemmatimonadetes bacterium]|nr:hypothetical protein [Gemmatimonadota bacterium]